MNNHFKELLNKYHLILVYKKLNSDGYIVRTPHGYPNFLFIKQGLADIKAEKVILHEIGHAKNDENVFGNYLTSYATRLKAESGADDFMIEEIIRENSNDEYDISHLNYVDLAQRLGTNRINKVRTELAKYHHPFLNKGIKKE